jgi:phosphoribosylformylglycinamidine synthase
VRVAILRFPGTWSDRDFQHVIANVVGIPADILWHADASGFDGYDAVVLPGGFAYGDYVRAGAIARLSPAIAALRRFADGDGLVLGSCNGFQILCEAGLLPGALTRNDHLEFRCDWIHMRVESEQSRWLRGLRGRVLRMGGSRSATATLMDASRARRTRTARWTTSPESRTSAGTCSV